MSDLPLEPGSLVEGCIYDSIAARDHGQRYAENVGWHVYVPPTRSMLQDRIRRKREKGQKQ